MLQFVISIQATQFVLSGTVVADGTTSLHAVINDRSLRAKNGTDRGKITPTYDTSIAMCGEVSILLCVPLEKGKKDNEYYRKLMDSWTKSWTETIKECPTVCLVYTETIQLSDECSTIHYSAVFAWRADQGMRINWIAQLFRMSLSKEGYPRIRNAVSASANHKPFPTQPLLYPNQPDRINMTFEWGFSDLGHCKPGLRAKDLRLRKVACSYDFFKGLIFKKFGNL